MKLTRGEAVFRSEVYFTCIAENRWDEAKKLLLHFLQNVNMPPYDYKKFMANIFHQTLQQVRSKSPDAKTFNSMELRLFKQLDKAYNFLHIEMIIEETFSTFAKECGQVPLSDSPFMRAIKAMIEENYAEAITLNDVAENLHLNYSYLSSCISQNSTMHFSEHLNEVRVRHAKELLTETDQSISVISENIGYADQSYFGKVFKKLVGLTPLQYRNKTGGHFNG